MPLSIEDIEARFGITLPKRLRSALLDSSDPIHEKTLLLTPENKDETLNIFRVNADMRALDWKKWPDHLVAFATEKCGDYFVFDRRTQPYRVHYIDPIETVPESIAKGEEGGFVFASFDDWYDDQISKEA